MQAPVVVEAQIATDHFTDFASGLDRIAIARSVMDAGGGLRADALWTGPAAHNASDPVIHNNATGELFYDADGSEAKADVAERALMSVVCHNSDTTAVAQGRVPLTAPGTSW